MTTCSIVRERTPLRAHAPIWAGRSRGAQLAPLLGAPDAEVRAGSEAGCISAVRSLRALLPLANAT